MMHEVQVLESGIVPYQEALENQKTLHQEVLESRRAPTLWLLEHPPTVTLGRNASREHLKLDEASFKQKQIELIHADRGGEVTAHMPGQLVVYCFFPLSGFGVRKFVTLLEKSVVSFSRELGIEAYTREKFPGVWVADKKLASLGIRIRDRVSYHGLAINLDGDLGVFDFITPCGITNCKPTSVSDTLGCKVSRRELVEVYLRAFQNVFEVHTMTLLKV